VAVVSCEECDRLRHAIRARDKQLELHTTHNVLCPDHRDKQRSCPACKVETVLKALKEARRAMAWVSITNMQAAMPIIIKIDNAISVMERP
jgi:hypothetical protein